MLFQRFRRPRWQHKAPDVRRGEVAKLEITDPADADILARLATDDPNPGVRVAAVRRLRDLKFLRQRLRDDGDATVREGARARYRQLLAGGDDLDVQARHEAVVDCDDPQILAHVARGAREESLRRLALERIDDVSVLAEAALHDPVARMRQHALARIDDEQVLEDLADRGRRLDRRTARVARQRLETLARERHRRDVRRNELARLCGCLETLTVGPGSQAERQRLLNQAQALEDAGDPDLKARLASASADSAARLAADSEDRKVAPYPGRSLVPEQDSEDKVADILAALEASDKPTVGLLNRLELRIAEGDEQAYAQVWLEAGRRYLTLSTRIAEADDSLEALSELVERLDWPQALPMPAAVRMVYERLECARALAQADENAWRDAREDERDRTLGALDEALKTAEATLDKGELRASRRNVNRVRQAAAAVPGPLDPAWTRRVARVRARFAELRDWRRFVVRPKQEALCEAMERLGEGDELNPEARFARIRELHQAWRDTGGTDSGRDRGLWERFQKATEQARASCAEWLEREASRREENRRGRETICSQLEAFLQAQEVPALATRELERIRRTARDDWQRFSPVDRRETQTLVRRFETLMDELTALIETHRNQARITKENLVAQARELVSDDNSERAARSAKALQQRWQAAGPTRPGAERSLWKAFRGACDAIFANRDAARENQRGVGEQRVADAEALCAEMEALADGADGVENGHGLINACEALRRRFDELRLPQDRQGHGVERRFERAYQAVTARVVQLRRDEALAALERSREAASLCRDESSNDTARMESLLATDPCLAPVRRALITRLEAPARAQDEGALRDLCIRMELLADVDSPAEDSERRMALRVEHLSAGMTGQLAVDEAPESDFWSLVAEWYGQPGQPGHLDERFNDAARRALAAESR